MICLCCKKDVHEGLMASANLCERCDEWNKEALEEHKKGVTEDD